MVCALLMDKKDLFLTLLYTGMLVFEIGKLSKRLFMFCNTIFQADGPFVHRKGDRHG